MGGRLRFIRTSIWNDDKFPFLGDDEKLVFLHLLTTPQANPIGLFSAGVGSLADEMRWPTERYQAALKNLCDTSTHTSGDTSTHTSGVTFDRRFRVVFLRHFFRHNIPNNHNHWKSWLKCLSEVPDCPLKEEWIATAAEYAKQWGPLYISALYETIGEPITNGSAKVTPDHPDTLPHTSGHTLPHTSGVTRKGKRKGRYGAGAGEDLVKDKDENRLQTSHLKGKTKELVEGIMERWPTYEIMHAIQVAQVLATHVKEKKLDIGDLLTAARDAWPDDREMYPASKNALHPYLVAWFRNAGKPKKGEADEPYYKDLSKVE